jgi:glycosyltransferase involved in cell wall biosynthesis
VTAAPVLSIVIPTFNNERVLRRAVDSWRRHGGSHPFELIVVEDGCRDGTRAYLEETASSEWGRRHLRWLHMDDAHELRCTNAGFAVARGSLLAAWQDDMFLAAGWFVPEILRIFDRYPDLGLLSLSRGLDLFPLDEPLARWEDLLDWRRMRSTIGPAPFNWIRVQEVDIVIRPWIVRRACLDRAGTLDEAFVPTEWDEADLAFRIRREGWRIGTHGYERGRAYEHLGSSTLGTLSDAYKSRVLVNGRLFHSRWRDEIARGHARPRRTWRRPMTPAAWTAALVAVAKTAAVRYRGPLAR